MKREKRAGNTHDKITRRVRQKIKMGRNMQCGGVVCVGHAQHTKTSFNAWVGFEVELCTKL